jgi:hypothetical protein
LHIGIELDLVARGEKRLERGLRQIGAVAVQDQPLAQALQADGREVVRPFGPIQSHLVAQAAQARDVHGEGHGRSVLLQPCVQTKLGALDRGPNRPKRVIQIDGER